MWGFAFFQIKLIATHVWHNNQNTHDQICTSAINDSFWDFTAAYTKNKFNNTLFKDNKVNSPGKVISKVAS